MKKAICLVAVVALCAVFACKGSAADQKTVVKDTITVGAVAKDSIKAPAKEVVKDTVIPTPAAPKKAKKVKAVADTTKK
jgi:hypothetical protein